MKAVTSPATTNSASHPQISLAHHLRVLNFRRRKCPTQASNFSMRLATSTGIQAVQADADKGHQQQRQYVVAHSVRGVGIRDDVCVFGAFMRVDCCRDKCDQEKTMNPAGVEQYVFKPVVPLVCDQTRP